LWATQRERARAARANAMAMRLTGIKEGKGGKAMVMATSMVGEWTAMVKMRKMVTKTKEGSEEEGNGMGGKSNGDGKEDCDGKR
jgi:hypothetical protein